MANTSSILPIIGALVANFAIAICKFIGAALTGSSAMISEGIHSLVDTGNQLLLLFGIRASKKPPDKNHPFGHGKEFYFWTLVVAILLFSLGGGMSVYEGIVHIKNPEPISDPLINYIVLALGVVFESIAWYLAYKNLRNSRFSKGLNLFKAVKRSKDPAVFAVLFEDTAAVLGLIIAAIGVYLSTTLNNAIYDGIASLAIGLMLGVVAILLARESKGLLIGESADKLMIEDIDKILKADPAVARNRHPLSMHFGPYDIMLALDVQFEQNRSEALETIVERLETNIKAAHPEVKRIFIEARTLIES